MSRFWTLMSGLHQLTGVPIWYDVKLMAWLVLPQFRGAAFIYNKCVREKAIKRYYPGIGGGLYKSPSSSPNGKMKDTVADLITPKKSS